MKRRDLPRGYQGGYRIGFLMIGVVALRALLFYQGKAQLGFVMVFIALDAGLYSLEPWLSRRFPWHKFFYFPLQTACVILLSNLRPFLDFQSLLYFPLWVQIFRTFSRRATILWTLGYVILLTSTLISGMGLWQGLASMLNYLATGAFLVSYDFLYLRTQADQAESERLLENLQVAHQKLKDYAAQAEALAAARERNRLARELHDSVSQVIFSILLTSQATRVLLERDSPRVLAEIERLQVMTSHALGQLRSLIAELRPH